MPEDPRGHRQNGLLKSQTSLEKDVPEHTHGHLRHSAQPQGMHQGGICSHRKYKVTMNGAYQLFQSSQGII